MRRRTILFLVIIFIFIPVSTGFAKTEQLATLDSLADNALQLVKVGRIDDAKKVVEQIGAILQEDDDVGSVSADEWRMIHLTYREVSEMFAQDEVAIEPLQENLTKFRLVVDAAMTDYDPLWLGMESFVSDTVEAAIAAYHSGDQVEFKNQLNTFFHIYDLLYPSIVIDVPVEKVQRVDAYVQYVKTNTDYLLTNDEAVVELVALEEEVRSLFDDTEEDEADPSLWWVIITTGGIIVATLSYAGFRKYIGEKEKKRRFDRNHKN